MPPIKSIAVPPNLRRPDRDRRAAAKGADLQLVPPTPEHAARPGRTLQAHPAHRYRIGERLRMGQGGHTIARAASFCQVVSLLPYEGYGSLLYRVRSETEQFERIVAEADLSRNTAGP